MNTLAIDRATIARKRAEAESLELIARRLKSEASELELKLLMHQSVRNDPQTPFHLFNVVSRDFAEHVGS